jgi:ABC-2 type transport system permease protein
MRRLLATAGKEARILGRDRAGLAVLFLMPAVLVTVVAVVQEAALRLMGSPNLKIVLIDDDRAEIGQALKRGLLDAGVFDVIDRIDDQAPTIETVRPAVAKGRYQGALILASGATTRAKERAGRLVEDVVAGRVPMPGSLPGTDITVVADPALPDAYRKLLRNTTASVLQGVEMRFLFMGFAKTLEARIVERIRAELPAVRGLAGSFKIPEFAMPERPGMLLAVEEVAAAKEAWVEDIPSSAQHNVPAWTIFAMFLIVIPLAGTMIHERREGTLRRLWMIPGAYVPVVLGKALLYLAVCMAQFGLMFAIGLWLLPLLDVPPLDPGHAHGGLILLAFATATAAVAFGMAVGAVARTPEQASMFGATLVVIAAAVGGVMLPTFLMPKAMRQVASFSPLGRAQEGFLDLLMRGANAVDILPHVLFLAAFAAAGTAVALTFYRQRD